MQQLNYPVNAAKGLPWAVTNGGDNAPHFHKNSLEQLPKSWVSE